MKSTGFNRTGVKIARTFSSCGLELKMFYIYMYDAFEFEIELTYEVISLMSKSFQSAMNFKKDISIA